MSVGWREADGHFHRRMNILRGLDLFRAAAQATARDADPRLDLLLRMSGRGGCQMAAGLWISARAPDSYTESHRDCRAPFSGSSWMMVVGDRPGG